MVNSPDYLERDMYDVVAPYIEDRDALDHAFALLGELESLALSYDAESGAMRCRTWNESQKPHIAS